VYEKNFQKQRFCRCDSVDISSALQYSSEYFFLWGYLRARCTKKIKDKGGFEREHQGRSSSNLSHHAATSGAELPGRLVGMCQQGRHSIQEVNIVIKML
jgi:hypothetical protein